MKKILFSLLVVATAVGMSSYVNAPKELKFTTTYLVQSSAGSWVERTVEPASGDCSGNQAKQCYYQVNDNSILTGGSYTTTDINNFESTSPAKIVDGSHSSPALYTGD